LAVLALLAYANSFSSELVLDTRRLLLDPRIHSLTLANLVRIFDKTYRWPQAVDGIYRPLTTLTLLFNYAVLGNGPHTTGYHIVNILLHVGNIWLVYALARRLLHRRPAFLAAALWAVHPVGTEAVTNIAGRADLLATLCVLSGLLIYARLEEWSGWRMRAALAVLFVAAAAGALSKENGTVLLGMIFLWDLCRATPPDLPRRASAMAYAAVSAALLMYSATRAGVLSAAPAPLASFVDNPMSTAGFLAARWTAIKVIALDLGLLLWPVQLSSDYSYRQVAVAGLWDPVAWMALGIVLAVLTVAAVRYRRDRLLFFTVGFFSIALLPTSNLIFRIGAIMAVRFLYLPSIAFAIVLVALAERAIPRKAASALLGAAILLCGGRTFARNFAWHDNLALAASDVRSVPGSFKPHENLAVSLYLRDPKGNLDQAIEEEYRAWAILAPLPPGLAPERTPGNLGLMYRAKGDALGGPRTAEGRAWYEKSVAVLLRAREISRAVENHFDERQRAERKPLSWRLASQDTYLDLSTSLAGLGRYEEALAASRYGLGLDPHRIQAYQEMAEAYQEMGRFEDAAVVFEEMGMVEGFATADVDPLGGLYRKIAGGSCAVSETDGETRLNFQCPLVARDVCRASAELTEAYQEARMYPDASRVAETAVRQFACGRP
jgi:tetratricopeptide (TPR) repeat protein